MNAHDVIARAFSSGYQTGAPSGMVAGDAIRALSQAGFAVVELPKPRVVTTAEELIALPVDTIVRENGRAEWVWEKYGIDRTGKGEDEWYRMGWDGTFNPDAITLPATVIFEGAQS